VHRLQDARRDPRETTRLNPAVYRGRFAPSPTGPLHFGSLVAALGSFLQARARHGEWLVRIDDLDSGRNRSGAADDILRTLDALGLHADGAIARQSERRSHYLDALADLRRRDLIFDCGCTRRETVNRPYPGTCRGGLPSGRRSRSLRLKIPDGEFAIRDAIQGEFHQNLRSVTGDIVVRRADGVIAYHLATVIDDALQGVSEVVRGADLLDTTPCQALLARMLGFGPPAYAHLPVAVDQAGRKLSKQNDAPALDSRRPSLALARALAFLGHAPPPALAGAPCRDLLEWGMAAWSLDRVPKQRAVSVPAAY
jgi:glutamyl-Q tRNA(Asp) synthetase